MAESWLPQLGRSGQAIYLDIVEALEQDLQSGKLKIGTRLPSQRKLAEDLGLALGTVTRAYSEACNRGLIRSYGKRGTFVERSDQFPDDEEPASLSATNVVDLGYNYPATIVDPDPAEVIRQIAASPNNRRLMRYVGVEGCGRHRQAGAEWIKMLGMSIDEARVFPTQGAQQALWAVLTSLAMPGDTIAADEYTYSGVIGIARVLNLRLAAVSSDEYGIIPEKLEAVCESHKPKAVYLVPTLNNPTNATLPIERRHEIVRIANKYGLYIIEDEIYRALHDQPPTLLSELSPERTFLVASASKMVAGGLRVGFVVPPGSMVSVLRERLWIMSLVAAPLTHEVFARWIIDGTVSRIIEARRKDALARQNLAEKHLGGLGSFAKSNSYFIWLRLPDGWTSNSFSSEAQRRGVIVSPSDLFAIGEPPPANAVRICLAAASDFERLEFALGTLANILKGVSLCDRCAL